MAASASLVQRIWKLILNTACVIRQGLQNRSKVITLLYTNILIRLTWTNKNNRRLRLQGEASWDESDNFRLKSVIKGQTNCSFMTKAWKVSAAWHGEHTFSSQKTNSQCAAPLCSYRGAWVKVDADICLWGESRRSVLSMKAFLRPQIYSFWQTRQSRRTWIAESWRGVRTEGDVCAAEAATVADSCHTMEEALSADKKTNRTRNTHSASDRGGRLKDRVVCPCLYWKAIHFWDTVVAWVATKKDFWRHGPGNHDSRDAGRVGFRQDTINHTR